jgi:hypothetical protein
MRGWRAILLSLGLAFAVSAGAQRADDGSERRSHIPIPGAEPGMDPQKLFDERLKQMEKRVEDLEKLRKLLGNQDVNKLIDDLKNQKGIDLHDPRVRDQLKKFADQQNAGGAQMKLTPEDIDRLKGMLEKLQAQGKGKDGGVNPDWDWLKGKHDPMPPRNAKGKKGREPPPFDRPEGWTDPEAQERARKQLEEWSKQFENWADKLDDAPALQDAVRDLGRAFLEMRGGDLPPEDRLDTQLADLNRYSRDVGGWLRDSWKGMGDMGGLGDLKLPPMPRFDLPKPTLPEIRPVSPVNLPHSLPNVSGPSGSWKEIVLVIGGCVLAVILWKVLRLILAIRRGKDNSAWKLGPWPLDPSKIASREDLVRTFEYLSLLRCGYPARTWNHLAIASQLGGETNDRRQAARQLAALYEQARYAPGDESLPAEALAAARRDLCFLAGVAAV